MRVYSLIHVFIYKRYRYTRLFLVFIFSHIWIKYRDSRPIACKSPYLEQIQGNKRNMENLELYVFYLLDIVEIGVTP